MSNELSCFFRDFAEKLPSIEKAIAELQEDNVKREDETSEHDSRLDDLESRVEDLEKINDATGDPESRIDELEAAVKDLQKVIENQRLALEANRHRFEDFLGQLSNLIGQI